MTKFLNSVLKVLPAIQARQITDMLNELKVKGEIKNVEEFQAKLRELSELVNNTEPKPSYRHLKANTWDYISAEVHNLMMTSLKNDIQALFMQIDEIGVKVDDHHFLMMKSIFSDIERGLDEQESKIKELEWLSGDGNEFTLALVNSFKSTTLNKVPRSEIGAETLYFDNRTYKNKTVAELPSAVVSEHGQKLILPVHNEAPTHPISVRLFTDESSYGTKVQPELDNPISNIIDKTTSTFWTRNVYLDAPVEKVTTVLQFDLGLAKDVDYVIIQGASKTPFYVDKVEGISSDGSIISLVEEEVVVNRAKRIDFRKVFVKGIKITFSSRSYFRAEYFYDKKSSVFKVLQPEDEFNNVDRAAQLGPLTTEVLSSENLIKLLNVPTGTSQQINSYLYPFGLDNVWFGNSLYNDSGIFVSKPLEGSNFGVIGVQADENLTSNASNSIEYEIIKKDLSPQYREIKFPIPYLDQTSVVSERLILTKRQQDSTINNAGSLRFCPYVRPDYNTTDHADPIVVYENGRDLIKGKDYEIAIKYSQDGSNFEWLDNFSSTKDFSNFQFSPPKMWIRIIKPKSNAVYTADYTIRTSTSAYDDNTVWLDEGKTVYMSEDGRVNFLRENSDVTIESEIYLQITLRRNAAAEDTSPELNEYAILGATYNV